MGVCACVCVCVRGWVCLCACVCARVGAFSFLNDGVLEVYLCVCLCVAFWTTGALKKVRVSGL